LFLSSFLVTVGECRKLTILSAHSSACNLFVTSLPLFDLVYASDKATFRTNYLSLNQVPEAGLVLHNHSRQAFTNLVFGRRTLTASEAKDLGLVTEVLWPARFHEEVVIRVRAFLRSEVTPIMLILYLTACIKIKLLNSAQENSLARTHGTFFDALSNGAEIIFKFLQEMQLYLGFPIPN
jgi:enoyl-CoA hydratase/carnithine racemase